MTISQTNRSLFSHFVISALHNGASPELVYVWVPPSSTVVPTLPARLLDFSWPDAGTPCCQHPPAFFSTSVVTPEPNRSRFHQFIASIVTPGGVQLRTSIVSQHYYPQLFRNLLDAIVGILRSSPRALPAATDHMRHCIAAINAGAPMPPPAPANTVVRFLNALAAAPEPRPGDLFRFSWAPEASATCTSQLLPTSRMDALEITPLVRAARTAPVFRGILAAILLEQPVVVLASTIAQLSQVLHGLVAAIAPYAPSGPVISCLPPSLAPVLAHPTAMLVGVLRAHGLLSDQTVNRLVVFDADASVLTVPPTLPKLPNRAVAVVDKSLVGRFGRDLSHDMAEAGAAAAATHQCIENVLGSDVRSFISCNKGEYTFDEDSLLASRSKQSQMFIRQFLHTKVFARYKQALLTEAAAAAAAGRPHVRGKPVAEVERCVAAFYTPDSGSPAERVIEAQIAAGDGAVAGGGCAQSQYLSVPITIEQSMHLLSGRSFAALTSQPTNTPAGAPATPAANTAAAAASAAAPLSSVKAHADFPWSMILPVGSFQALHAALAPALASLGGASVLNEHDRVPRRSRAGAVDFFGDGMAGITSTLTTAASSAMLFMSEASQSMTASKSSSRRTSTIGNRDEARNFLFM